MSESYAELCGAVIAAFRRVWRELSLRHGCDPATYVQALAAELERRSHAVQAQDNGCIDLLVDEAVPVQLLRVRRIGRQEQARFQASLRAGGWPVGLLLNASAARPEAQRLYGGKET